MSFGYVTFSRRAVQKITAIVFGKLVTFPISVRRKKFCDAADLSERIIQLFEMDRIKPQPKVQETCESEPGLEIKVTEILHQIGVPAHIKGYHYLRDSIIMAIETPDIINAVTKQLYPSVAKHYNTTASRVERAIRYTIEVAWGRGDVDILNPISVIRSTTRAESPQIPSL